MATELQKDLTSLVKERGAVIQDRIHGKAPFAEAKASNATYGDLNITIRHGDPSSSLSTLRVPSLDIDTDRKRIQRGAVFYYEGPSLSFSVLPTDVIGVFRCQCVIEYKYGVGFEWSRGSDSLEQILNTKGPGGSKRLSGDNLDWVAKSNGGGDAMVFYKRLASMLQEMAEWFLEWQNSGYYLKNEEVSTWNGRMRLGIVRQTHTGRFYEVWPEEYKNIRG